MSERVRVILNGDDYGYSQGVNRGIEKSIKEGILTSTSVMVNRPASGTTYLQPREAEVGALTDSRVKDYVASSGIELISWKDL